MSPAPNNTARVLLHDADEEHAPPELNCLEVAAIGDRVFLNIVKVTEDHEHTTHENVAEVSVDLPTLLKALHTVIDSHRWGTIMQLVDLRIFAAGSSTRETQP